MDYDYLKYKKILIVDDEADLREMVTSILEQDGFKTIKTAGTVAEALKICRDWEPDLAVLDVMLPDGNGFSLFEQKIKPPTIKATRAIPMIAFSSISYPPFSSFS